MSTYKGFIKHCSENELLEFFSENEELVSSEIVRRFDQKLQYFVQKMLTCDTPTAKDITQMTFYKVILALRKNQYRFEGFTTWIHTIAKNEVLNFVRSKQLYNTRKKNTYDIYYCSMLTETPNFILEYKENQQKINEILKTFSDEEKLLIELRAQKMGYDKISKITNSSKPHTYCVVKECYRAVKEKLYK